MEEKGLWVAFSEIVRVGQYFARTQWRWMRVDVGGVTLKSSEGFDTLPDCLRDARAHGLTDDAVLEIRYESESRN